VTELETKVERSYPLAHEASDALMGAVYPLSRDALTWVARENEAGRVLVSLLSQLPAQEYRSLEDVQRALDHVP
jgi:hypothetical protein